MFPENIAALDHLSDRQFRWALRMLALCLTPPRPGEPDRPYGALPLELYEGMWRLVGAHSLAQWLAEGQPVLNLFAYSEDGKFIIPVDGIAGTMVLDNPQPKAQSATSQVNDKNANEHESSIAETNDPVQSDVHDSNQAKRLRKARTSGGIQ